MGEIWWLDWGFIDWNLVVANYEYYLLGIWNTINLTVLSLIIGFALAVPMAFARANRHPIFNGPIWCFTYFIRGTPLLVQAYLIYFGLGSLDIIHDSFLWFIFKDAWACALLAFVISAAAYQTEILRGSIEATPFGEVEAAKACGMSNFTRMRRIILPSALRRALPMYSNEVIFTVHSSVVASTLTVVDILGAGRIVNGKYYVAYEGFISAAVLYMIIIFVVSRIFKWAENRYHGHLRQRDVSKPEVEIIQAPGAL